MRAGAWRAHGCPMNSTETFQIPLEVAESYESQFVPAIFAEWAPRILDATGVGPGHRVIDVGCGTGIVARHALDRVGGGGHVVGVDPNDAMLTVARRLAPGIEWMQGSADALPVDDDGFDAVTCQMAMMFFPDRVAAFAEMARVACSEGSIACVVPASLDAQPAYRVFVDVAVERVGADAASLLGTYWNCGDLDALVADAESAGLVVTDRSTIAGTARFESAQAFVTTEIESSPLVDRIDGDQSAAICGEVERRLPQYALDNRFDVPLFCHLLTARPA